MFVGGVLAVVIWMLVGEAAYEAVSGRADFGRRHGPRVITREVHAGGQTPVASGCRSAIATTWSHVSARSRLSASAVGRSRRSALMLTALILTPVVAASSWRSQPSKRSELHLPLGFGLSMIPLALAGVLFFQFDVGEAGFQFTEQATWYEPWGIGWNLGVDGISLGLIVLTGTSHPDRLGGFDRTSISGSRSSWCSPAARSRSDRHIPLPGLVSVLRVLRGGARSDVLHHRDLGLRTSHLRRGQVLPVHGFRLCIHAGGHRGVRLHPLLADRYTVVRLRRPLRSRLPPRLRNVGCSRRLPSLSPSRSLCSRCTRGCPTPTSRRRRPARFCWQA